MAITYSISQKNRVRGGFDSPEKIKELLESNSKWPAETYKILENSDDLGDAPSIATGESRSNIKTAPFDSCTAAAHDRAARRR